MLNPCECDDHGCVCEGECEAFATHILYRIDMQDETGTPMCSKCTDDTEGIGLFRVQEIEEELS